MAAPADRKPSAAQDRRETDTCGCASGGRHVCGLPGVASGPTLDGLSAAQGHKHAWIRRLPGVHRVICETCGVEKPVKR